MSLYTGLVLLLVRRQGFEPDAHFIETVTFQTGLCDIASTPDAQTAGSPGGVLYVVSYETSLPGRFGPQIPNSRAVDRRPGTATLLW